MTGYNDGNWHGWNGGDCPVHPLSEVDCVWHDARTGEAGASIQWAADGGIAWDQVIRFRVTRAHVEPRVIWAWQGSTYDTRKEAESWRDRMISLYPNYGYADVPITKWQEVPE